MAAAELMAELTAELTAVLTAVAVCSETLLAICSLEVVDVCVLVCVLDPPMISRESGYPFSALSAFFARSASFTAGAWTALCAA